MDFLCVQFHSTIKQVIPYIEKTLFTQSKIDDEIYTELKNNLSDEFAELRKKLLEEFK